FPGFHCIHGGDCALLSRFPIEPERLDLKVWGEQMARVKTPAGGIRILNVRMPLPALRLNLFSARARAEMRLSHRQRAEGFGRLGKAVRKLAEDGPLILAGDFNTPIRSTLLRPVRALLTDAFRQAGSGWGNTMTHDFPVSRIDAIFVSGEFRVLRAQSLTNGISDHRTVLAEALLEEDDPGD
ncbi:MAG TPA: endonuclease/exonuclease/phosphatase family protein, partial [Sumerlaeia bacterium]|nr:endonuclease/exonuclease/phosphatase family protein [Sumerlaeia bacterium]